MGTAGTIKTTIQVYDAMTPALRSMIRATNIMISSLERMQRSSAQSFDTRALKAARSEMVNAESSLKQIDEAIKRSANSQKQLNNNVRAGDSNMKGLVNSVRNLAAAYVGIRGVAAAGREADEYVSTSTRLELINDGLRTQAELQNQIFAAAHRSRAEYSSMAQTTAKLGLLAGDAFKNNSELIYFAETMQKAFKVSGASTSESANAMYQLTQAMASGRLQGDEYRSIIENAPMLAKSIENYMLAAGYEGTLKDWASESLLTADVIKASLFAAADDINAKFETLPNTFGGVFSQIKGIAVNAMGGAFTSINDALNEAVSGDFYAKVMEKFHGLSLGVMNIVSKIKQVAVLAGPAISQIASYFTPVIQQVFSVNGLFGALMNTVTRLVRNSGVQRFFAGIAKSAKAVVQGLEFVINTVGYMVEAFSGFLPIAGEALVMFTVIKIATAALTPVVTAAFTAVGALTGKYISMTAAAISAKAAQDALNASILANPYAMVAAAVATLITLYGQLASSIQEVNRLAGAAADITVGGYTKADRDMAGRMGITNSDAKMINDLVQDSNEQVEGLRNKIAENDKWLNDYNNGNLSAAKAAGLSGEIFHRTSGSDINLGALYQAEMGTNYLSGLKDEAKRRAAENEQMKENIKYIQIETASDAADMLHQGQEFKNRLNAIEDYQLDPGAFEIPVLDGIKKDTGKMADSMEVTEENLQYLRDIADRDTINRFTTAEIHVDMTNNNSITNTNDVDGIVTSLEIALEERLNAVAEGSYSF